MSEERTFVPVMVWYAIYTFPNDPAISESLPPGNGPTSAYHLSQLVVTYHGQLICKQATSNFIVAAR